jgi:hypothetical protein
MCDISYGKILTCGLSSRAPVGATEATNKSIFAGKAVTGFSNVEEMVDKVKEIPFLLEDRIVSPGWEVREGC